MMSVLRLMMVMAVAIVSVATGQAAPDLNNRAGAVNLAPGEAKLQGRLDGGGDAEVIFYYGPADGGTTAGSWANKIEINFQHDILSS